MKIGVHITHEVVHKIGGIGSVIDGLCTADNYKSFFDHTLLYGPLFSYSGDVFSRLGKGGEVLYSNHDSYDANNYHDLFMDIITKHNIDIVFGKRTLVNEFNINKINTVDIVLIGISKMRIKDVDSFKHKLWEKYGIESDRYSDWDYEQYLRIAIPYLEILDILHPNLTHCFHFSHEYMGVPSALTVGLYEKPGVQHKTIFYAHEISPCRVVVEKNPGHDISFYNILQNNKARGRSFEDEYGNQRNSYRAELVKRSAGFDYIFAVSDIIKEEYKYFIPDIDEKKIKVVNNGIPIHYISHDEKLKSRNILQEYINNLFNFTPDIIFTHVTRLVVSKGIWRDITFLYLLDESFQQHGLKGAYILLSTLIGTGRDPSIISSLEKEYGWPIIHHGGWPDLVGPENDIYNFLALFNARSRSIKGIFLNQFGFNRRKCGERVPEEAKFSDLRTGSDAEFGFSIYEPFGIAQLETLPFGGIAALSSSCGCSCFIEKSLSTYNGKHYKIFDFISGTEGRKEISDLTKITTDQRFQLERELFQHSAKDFFQILPKNDSERLGLLDAIQEKLEILGWESIVSNVNFSSL
jgi:hypothetical protein